VKVLQEKLIRHPHRDACRVATDRVQRRQASQRRSWCSSSPALAGLKPSAMVQRLFGDPDQLAQRDF